MRRRRRAGEITKAFIDRVLFNVWGIASDNGEQAVESRL
jgi:hypothetical protein